MKNLCFFAGLILLHVATNAQVKIGDNVTSINSASLLELETADKGFVLPRVSITDVSTSSPLASGLLTGTVVYNTNSNTTGGSGTGIYYWDGSKWNFLTNTTNYWSLTGNSGTNASDNFIGTTDQADFVMKTNNTDRIHILGANSGNSKAGWVGIGITPPRSSLDVTGNFTNKNVITIQNTSNSGYSSVDMMDNTGTLKGTFGYGNSGTGNFFGSRDYFSTYGSDFVLNANSGDYNFFMKGDNGYIGINTSSPSERLHVNGNIYLDGALMPGGDAGTSGYMLTSAGAGATPTWKSTGSLWGTTGNAGTTSSNFLGTTDAKALVFKTNNNERMRLTQGGALLINTSSASGSEVLNANGSFKLGSVGTITKNLVTFSGTVNVSVPAQFNSINLGLGLSVITLSSGTSYADVTITLPVTLSSTQAIASVSPAFDLPGGVQIAFARVISTTQVKVRFINAAIGSQSVSGTFYVQVSEF